MVKGCQKKVICIKDTGSEVFEEAFFIIKPLREGMRRESDMIREARRILDNGRIQSNNMQLKSKNKQKFKIMIFSFLFGALSTVAVAAVITAFVNLI